MESLPSPFVFLSYAAPDRDRALAIFDVLSTNGISVWLDVKCLVPGQNWNFEIQRALNTATLVILLISRESIDRTGYVQYELRLVLEQLRYRPVNQIYAIPVILEADMAIPEQVRNLHCLRMPAGADHGGLIGAIRTGFEQLAENRQTTQDDVGIAWSFGSFKEAWEGLPGYDLEISWPIYRSTRYPLITHISDIIKGELEMMTARERAVKLRQDHGFCTFGQSKWMRTNSLSVTCADPVVKNLVLSQHATIDGYGAGAAHGYHSPRSWVFVLEPLAPVEDLRSIFTDPATALPRLQEEVRLRLREELAHREGGDSAAELSLSSQDGIAKWEDFANFGFDETGLTLSFPPYQVACYAFGIISIKVPYEPLLPLLRPAIADALGLDRSYSLIEDLQIDPSGEPDPWEFLILDRPS
ncbi:MAG TPA: TIR domain-containing protein [Longimicrobium sp.]|nr:TIR domain-containing protein [Longimicrobium sp.]